MPLSNPRGCDAARRIAVQPSAIRCSRSPDIEHAVAGLGPRRNPGRHVHQFDLRIADASSEFQVGRRANDGFQLGALAEVIQRCCRAQGQGSIEDDQVPVFNVVVERSSHSGPAAC